MQAQLGRSVSETELDPPPSDDSVRRPFGAKFSVSFLTRSSSVNMIGGLISQGLKFFLLIYVARQFSVSEFGLLSFAFAVYAYQFVICNSGLQFFGSRAVAKSGQLSRALFAEIVCLRTGLAIFGTIGTLLVLLFLPGVSRTELVLVGVFGLSNLPWAGFPDWAFQGLHRQEVSAILNVTLQALWLMLTVLAIRFGMGIMGVPAALVGATVIASTVGYVWLHWTESIVAAELPTPGIFTRSCATLKSAAPLGLALWLNTVLIWSDAIIVRLARGERAVGWYAGGNRAGLALGMLASYYVQGAFPLLSRASQEGISHFQPLFQHCYEDMALVFVPGSLWAIFYAREIVLLLFKNADYLASVPVFRVFQLVFLITALLTLYGIGALAAFHRDRQYRKGFVEAVAVFIPLCFGLTLYLGILGAAIAVFATQVFLLILFSRASQDLVQVRHSRALAWPISLGLSVVIISKLFGLSLFWSAGLMATLSTLVIAIRFRNHYFRDGFMAKGTIPLNGRS
jgi:O-antigen/teichoic acid export membrane protein